MQTSSLMDTDSASSDIAARILVIRGQRVVLDSDLAALYGVSARRLNEQVRRNSRRFPGDFMFALTEQEVSPLRSQFATSKMTKPGRGGRRYLPLAFTEHGAVMAASILNSERAVEMSVYVVRAFIRLKTLMASDSQLARKLDALEKSVAVLDADAKRQFKELRAAVFSLASPPAREQYAVQMRAEEDYAPASNDPQHNWLRRLVSA